MRIDKGLFVASRPLFKAIILTATQFEDMELFFPYFRLLEEGVQVDVAAPRKQKLTGENGYTFENVDLTFSEVNPDDYDLLVLPGGRPDGAPRQSVRANTLKR